MSALLVSKIGKLIEGGVIYNKTLIQKLNRLRQAQADTIIVKPFISNPSKIPTAIPYLSHLALFQICCLHLFQKNLDV
jgi:hypothetical protein